MTPEQELSKLGISCAMNFGKLSLAEKRIMLDFFRAQKRIEEINDQRISAREMSIVTPFKIKNGANKK